MKRDEIIDMMARNTFNSAWPKADWSEVDREVREIYIGYWHGTFNAIEAAGLRIVPVEALEARVKMLETLLKDVADDLEGELDRFYGVTLNYPSQNRRYERDMQIVRDARAALQPKESEATND